MVLRTLTRFAALFALLSLLPASAAAGDGTLTYGKRITGPFWEYTYAGKPSGLPSGWVIVITDAASAGSCSAGGGTARSLCRSLGNGTFEALGGAGNAGTVTHTAGNLTLNAAMFGNGTADSKVDTNITTDGSGNLTDVSTTAQKFVVSANNAGIDLNEGTGAGVTAAAAHDVCWGDSTAHGVKCNNNATGAGTVLLDNSSNAISNKSFTGASSNNAVTLLSFQPQAAEANGNGAAQNIYSYTVSGNVLGVNKCIRATAYWLHSTGTGAITYGWSWGGTALTTWAGGTIAATNIRTSITVCNNAATNAQTIMQDPAIESQGTSAIMVTNTMLLTTGAKDTTSNQALAITFNVASGNKVTPSGFVVELLQ